MKKFAQTAMLLILLSVTAFAQKQTVQFINEPGNPPAFFVTGDSILFSSIQQDICGPESACQGDLVTSPNPACPGQWVTLTASPTQGLPPYTYQWWNGFTGQQQQLQFWSQSNIWVQVTDATGCSWFADGTIFMSTNGANPTISGNLAFCSGSSTTLTASGAGTFSWTGPNGFTSTTAMINVNMPGTYTVTVNNGGCSGSATVNVTMSPAPVVSISGPNGFCPGASATLMASSSVPGSTFVWSTGQSGSSLTTNVGGTYTVTATATGGCSGTATKNVTAFLAPSAVIKVTRANDVTTLSVSTPTALWSTGANTPTINNAPNGIYAVTVTDANGCIATNPGVEVNMSACAPPCPLPVASFTFMVNGPLVTFTNTSQNATSYMWTFGDNTTSMAANPTHAYAPGTYQVTLTAINACGSSTTTQTVSITCPPPTAGFTFVIDEDFVSFTNTSTNANSYLWNFGDGSTSTQANPNHTYAASGTYTVTLTATNACGSVMITKTLNLSFCMSGITNNQGVPDGGTFCPNGQFILTAPHPSNPTTTYLWSQGQMVGASWQALGSTTPGWHSYWVTEQLVNGTITQYCFTYEVDCDGLLSSEVLDREVQMQIYPNPTSGPVSIDINGESGVYGITITNLASGQQITQKVVKK